MSGMKPVDLYARVRYACHVEGLSQRETARRFGIDTKTVRKMLTFAVPGYRRSKPPARPKLDPFTPIINRILEADRSAPPKQRHTAKRIYERLRDEHAYVGDYTIVKDYVREQQARAREMFVPLVHPPGHAQVDFGEAVAVIAGSGRPSTSSALTCPSRMPALSKPTRPSVPKPFSTGMFPPSASSAGCRVRSCMTTPSWRWPASWAMANGSARAALPSCSRTTCSSTASAGRARATTKARSRAWSVMLGATAWCRSRRSRALRR